MTTTPDWVKNAVFYQIFPDRFARSERLAKNGLSFEPWDTPPTTFGFKGGDLYGVAERLDYLQDLGINALYLNPIFASASNHRYHTFDYYQVDPLLGGNDALRHLLDEAHKRGIRVVLDGVFNHASRGFWQFHHVLETGEASPYKNWFHFNPEFLAGKKSWGAYPTHHQQQSINNEGSFKAIGYQGWWNLPALPKFNTDTPAVREFLFGVAEHWIRFGIDGWRLDVAGEINDDSFWQEFRRRVRAINPEAYIVGEIWHEAQRWLQGDQFDATMNYLITAAALSFFGGPHLDMGVVNHAGGLQGRVYPMDAYTFANEVDRVFHLYQPEFTYSQLNLLDSHDMPRFLSCVGGQKIALKQALLFLLTYPGAPCIYYGDEVGVDGRHDPECRKSFPWNEERWDTDLLAYTKACIKLRRDHPSLRGGSFQRLHAEGQVYAFARTFEREQVLVAINAGDAAAQVEVQVQVQGAYASIFGKAQVESAEKSLRLKLEPRGSVVLKRTN
jgi:neopullulanase